MGVHGVDALPGQRHGPGTIYQAEDGLDGAGLADAVAPDDRGHAPIRDGEADVFDHLLARDAATEVGDGQDVVRHSELPR